MPLSEHEQRLLDQIERELYAEDPKFASTVRGTRMHRPTRRRRLQGAVLFVVGVAMLVLGVAGQAAFLRIAEVPWLSVLGFVVMFAGVLLAVMTMRSQGAIDGDSHDAGKVGRAGPAHKSSFTQKMEERFRRRFEDR